MSMDLSDTVLIAYICKSKNSPPTERQLKNEIPEALDDLGQRLSIPTECVLLFIPKPDRYALVYRIAKEHKDSIDKQCELLDLPVQIFKKVTAVINTKSIGVDAVVLKKCLSKCDLTQCEKDNELSVTGYLFQINYLNALLANKRNITQSGEEPLKEEEAVPNINQSVNRSLKNLSVSQCSTQQDGATGPKESNDSMNETYRKETYNNQSKFLENGTEKILSTGVMRKPESMDQDERNASVMQSGKNNTNEFVQPDQGSANDMSNSFKAQRAENAEQPSNDNTNGTMLLERTHENQDNFGGENEGTETYPQVVQHTIPVAEKKTRTVPYGHYQYVKEFFGGDSCNGLELKLVPGKREYEVHGNKVMMVDTWKKNLRDCNFKEVNIEARKSHLTAKDFKNMCASLAPTFASERVGFYLDERLMNLHIIGPEDTVMTMIDYVYRNLKVPTPREFRKRKDSGTIASGDKGVNETEAPKEKEKCPICFDDIDVNSSGVTVLEKCKHAFCIDCIDQAFKVKPVCPTCGALYGKLTGTQPVGGRMDVTESYYPDLPGYQGCGIITINYSFLDGRQGSEHPDPGKPYRGIKRTAYLPNNREGKKVAKLLKQAFDARIVFTIGRSTTTGKEGKITWNDIHHKTNTYGGPQKFGYPDPDYLNRVQGELADKGFK